MKGSKILRSICYIFTPILIAILILSIIYISIKENDYYNEEKYYSSKHFVYSYMESINNVLSQLIYYQGSNAIIDGDIEIFHTTSYNYYFNAQEKYFLVIYKNKALTNVSITSDTNTVEEIKSYINNKEAKKVNIINGEIYSESDIIQKLGTEHFDAQVTYYSSNRETETTIYPYPTYITTSKNDFEIYTCFVEKFEEDSEAVIMKNIINKLPMLDNQYVYVIIPFSSIAIILMLIYLIISIGHKKGSNQISLNDFDKIPLEIIITVSLFLGCLPFLILEGINDNYDAIISLLVTAYLIIYAISAITLHTIIKRIKSRTLLKTTLTGKVINLFIEILKKIYSKTKSICSVFAYSTNITTKVLLYSGIVGIIVLLIHLLFRNSILNFFFEILLICAITYKIVKILKEFKEIEKKLKEMYEGNNSKLLIESEFSSEFHNTVKYLNDISNGFENAIQDRIKSEKLKAELITNVSHDIKTPLTSIINYVDLLKQERINDKKVNEYIEILDNKSQRLKNLTEDLVEASKISTGNISLNLERINIVELINQAIGEFKDKFNEKFLEIIIDSKENEINIRADSKYMYRIIENLFSNISKYALENSRVYIDLIELHTQEEPRVIIEIKNISKNKLNISAEELMQRFVRGDKSRSTEGSGLGISISQNLTELQKGEFELKLDGDLFKVKLIFNIEKR